MSDKDQCADKKEDTELEDLLNSALEDFEKVSKEEEKKEEKEEEKDVEAKLMTETLAQTVDQLQNEELGSDNLGGASFQQTLEKNWLVEMLEEMDKYKELGGPDFESAISQTLRDLSQTSETLQDDTLAEVFSRTSLDDQQQPNILGFMQNMLQSLLSKDILYPSLKEIVDKYPTWLEEKKDTLEAKDLERYTKQLTLLQKVCVEFENEREDDSESTKQQRFERTLSLMQEIQNYGKPPEELVGEQPSLFQLNSDGIPNMSDLEIPQNCSVM